jgi:Flp pilus assembly pilin Flp
MPKIWQFLENESGATVIEYSMIAAGIGLALMVVFIRVGTHLTAIFNAADAGMR